jgi:hypothetical protein
MNASELATSMIAAARTSLGRDWKGARHYAEPELGRLARVLVDIGDMAARGDITEDEARSLFRIHRNTTEMVLLTLKGLGILAVENAINAALDVVRGAVNTAAGFDLV